MGTSGGNHAQCFDIGEHVTRISPQRLQTGGPEAHAPGKPLTLSRTPSSAACPDRAKPRHALLRAAFAGRRSVLGAPLAPRAKRRSEKVALYFLSVRRELIPLHGYGTILLTRLHDGSNVRLTPVGVFRWRAPARRSPPAGRHISSVHGA